MRTWLTFLFAKNSLFGRESIIWLCEINMTAFHETNVKLNVWENQENGKQKYFFATFSNKWTFPDIVKNLRNQAARNACIKMAARNISYIFWITTSKLILLLSYIVSFSWIAHNMQKLNEIHHLFKHNWFEQSIIDNFVNYDLSAISFDLKQIFSHSQS